MTATLLSPGLFHDVARLVLSEGTAFLSSIVLNPELIIDDRLHTELWTSWASLLRSYAAAHGLNAAQHAVVEVSSNEITLRVGSRWLRFTPTSMQPGEGSAVAFALNENGTVRLGHGPEQEMDLAAEEIAREMMQSAQ